MIGDKLVINAYHEENGRRIASACARLIEEFERPIAITVAGESGSGKSETAATTARELIASGLRVAILAQDDYFKLPPMSNAARRKEGIDWVGMGEVRLDLMDAHLAAAKRGEPSIVKPLVVFDEDRITEETLPLEGVDAVIAEGTYTTSLKEADFRAFIDRTYIDTLDHRKRRARDEAEGEFIEKILKIEHEIISGHKPLADLNLPPSY